MQNGNVKIKDLFNGDKIFNIPKYQRAYAWEEEHLESFLDDLLHQRSEKSYFLGTLLFHERDTHGDYEFIDVVDGQQRLTTIIIFMKVIISTLLKVKSTAVSQKTYSRYVYDGESYKLELENEDTGFLHNNIFEDVNPKKIETPSQKKLYDSKKYFKKKLSLLDVQQLERLFTVLISSDVILYVVNKISDATQIFELLNDRGRKLTNLEGVKSFLMYRIGCLNLKDDGEQSIDNVQSSFSSIYRDVERYSINENDVLRYHTIAFEKSKTSDYNSPEKYIKTKINGLFEKGEKDSIIKDKIINYVNRLKESFVIYNDIKENAYKLKSLDQLAIIGRINPFFPLMMRTRKYSQAEFDSFIKSLVKFTFRATLIGLRNKNENFYRYIREKEDYSDLFKSIIDDNCWNINKRVDEVLEYRNYFEWVNKNIIKFILFSYENNLRENGGFPQLSKDVYFSTDSREKLNIEHITAQNAKTLDMDDEFKENYLHSLGNLVIDTTSSNSRKGNNPVEQKVDEYTKAPIMSQNIINKAKVNWDDLESVKEFIDQRNSKIVDYIRMSIL